MGAWIETYVANKLLYYNVVAPYVGAWIETSSSSSDRLTEEVAPYVGAWIETELLVRSLTNIGRTLRGCVD